MIDIESQVFNKVAAKVRAVYPGIYMTGEYNRTPPKFPAVSIEEKDNQVWRKSRDTIEIENEAELMYEVNVYSNKVPGKKLEAKAIAQTVDEAMKSLGFTRRAMTPIPNLEDATVYRIVMRYRAIVGRDEFNPENYVIYHR